MLIGWMVLAGCGHAPPSPAAVSDAAGYLPAADGPARACPKGLGATLSVVEPPLVAAEMRLGWRLEVDGMPFAFHNGATAVVASIGEQPVVWLLLPMSAERRGFSGLLEAPPAAGTVLSAGYAGGPPSLHCILAEIPVRP